MKPYDTGQAKREIRAALALLVKTEEILSKTESKLHELPENQAVMRLNDRTGNVDYECLASRLEGVCEWAVREPIEDLVEGLEKAIRLTDAEVAVDEARQQARRRARGEVIPPRVEC